MRKVIFSILMAVSVMTVSSQAFAQEFYVYADKGSPQNHFIPSGWMGDTNTVKMNDQALEPYKGSTSMMITYKGTPGQGQGWAGIYWQSAQNNWGQVESGLDLSDFNKLVFMAKGSNGGEVITKVSVGGILENPGTGEPVEFPDTANAAIGPIRLTTEWQEYTINLADQDLSYVNGGLAIIFEAAHTSGEQTVYIDDIRYAHEEGLKPASNDTPLPLYVYADANSLDNHYVASGWMPATAARDIKMNTRWKEEPFSGDTCIKAEYKNNSGTRWAGIYWQNPANNWGNIPNAGINLKNATKLTFWAKGENGGEVINEFKVGGISSGEFIDSDSVTVGPIRLTPEWQQYEIDLRGKDLSYIIGGFGWATNIDVNSPDGVVFYLDEVKYE